MQQRLQSWGSTYPEVSYSECQHVTSFTVLCPCCQSAENKSWSFIIWASSWDYGTYHIGDQRRLRWACASALSRQSLPFAHMWFGSRQTVRSKIMHLAPLDGYTCVWRMSLRRTKKAIISWADSFKKWFFLIVNYHWLTHGVERQIAKYYFKTAKPKWRNSCICHTTPLC